MEVCLNCSWGVGWFAVCIDNNAARVWWRASGVSMTRASLSCVCTRVGRLPVCFSPFARATAKGAQARRCSVFGAEWDLSPPPPLSAHTLATLIGPNTLILAIPRARPSQAAVVSYGVADCLTSPFQPRSEVRCRLGDTSSVRARRPCSSPARARWRKMMVSICSILTAFHQVGRARAFARPTQSKSSNRPAHTAAAAVAFARPPRRRPPTKPPPPPPPTTMMPTKKQPCQRCPTARAPCTPLRTP